MKCNNCGATIPEGYLYCEKCGQEVQIVPDYNPLDDVLTAQVKGALEEEPSNRTRNKIPIGIEKFEWDDFIYDEYSSTKYRRSARV